jgi:hypothetical protein
LWDIPLETNGACRRLIGLSFGPATAYHRKIRRGLHALGRFSPATAAETREIVPISFEKGSKN